MQSSLCHHQLGVARIEAEVYSESSELLRQHLLREIQNQLHHDWDCLFKVSKGAKKQEQQETYAVINVLRVQGEMHLP